MQPPCLGCNRVPSDHAPWFSRLPSHHGEYFNRGMRLALILPKHVQVQPRFQRAGPVLGMQKTEQNR